MIEAPKIQQTSMQRCATLPLVVSRDQIGQRMAPGIRAVMAVMAEQGIRQTGSWFTHHFRRPTESFDFEICVPVDVAIVASGGVLPGQWPAMTVVRTLHSGSYDGLAVAWGEFIAWKEASGHRTAQDLWERYLVGPESSADPADWRTELNLQLLD